MNIKNLFLTLAGFLLLGIGAVGVFVPVLPTTPFVLAASVCLAGNPKTRAWLLKNRFFAEHFTNYRKRTGLKRRTVAISLAFLWGMLLFSVLLIGKLWGTLLLTAVGAAVTAHILCLFRPKPPRTKDVSCVDRN